MLPRFMSGYERPVDSKNRCHLPIEFRHSLNGESLYLQDRGDERILYLLPERVITDNFKEVCSPLDPAFNLEKLLEHTRINGSVSQLDIDRQGRVLLNLGHRERPSVVFLQGVGDYMLLYLGNQQQFWELCKENIANTNSN